MSQPAEIDKTLRDQEKNDVIHRAAESSHLPKPFVGRNYELNWLTAQFNKAKQGHVVIAAIEGDIGIGKTRLVESFCQEISDSALTVTAACNDTDLHLPYEPLTVILEKLFLRPDADSYLQAVDTPNCVLTELARLLPQQFPAKTPTPILGQGDEHRFHNGLSTWLGAVSRTQPLVIGLLDMQWSDRSTLAFIHYLYHFGQFSQPAAQPQIPIFIILTFRPDETDDTHPLTTLLREVMITENSEPHTINRFQQLSLKPLSINAYRDWLSTLTETSTPELFADHLWRQTEGNPLLLQFVLAEWLNAGNLIPFEPEMTHFAFSFNQTETTQWPVISMGLRALTEQGLMHLDARTQQVLLAIAIAHQPATLGFVQKLLNWQASELNEPIKRLLKSGVVVQENSDVQICHSFVRRVLLENANRPTLITLRARMAEILASGQSSRSKFPIRDAFERAQHSINTAEALNLWLEIADWAFNLHALQSARDLYWLALQVATQTNNTTAQMQIHQALGDVHQQSGDLRASMEHYQAAFGCATDPTTRMQIRCRMAHINAARGEYHAALTHLIMAREDLAIQARSPLPKPLMLGFIEAYLQQGDLDKARYILDEALNVIAKHEDDEFAMQALMLLAQWQTKHGEPKSAIETLRNALAQEPPEFWRARLNDSIGRLLHEQGEFSSAETALIAAAETHANLGAWLSRAYTLDLLSQVQQKMHNMEEALREAQESLRIHRQLSRVKPLTH